MEKYQLGYGCMRLPTLRKDDPASFDYEAINALFDAYLDQGFTYFDTAYTYHGYHGEEAVRRALVERHPRDRFELATKMPLRDFKDSEDMEKIFNEQLANCGVKYFDYYLLHNMGTNVYEKCRRHRAFGFVSRKKAEGKIKRAGMSFHDTPELLDEILSQYGGDLDFVQLQINYADWEQPNVQSRRCLETARRYGKPVFVMEPCKGGALVKLPEEAERLLKAIAPQASNASWALRFAASQEGVVRVLSGMNSMEQVLDNCKVFQNLQPLTERETAALNEARKIIEVNTAVPCTGCAYCTHGCPKNIAIPQYFALLNSAARATGGFSSQNVYYNNTALTHGKASECIGCRQCEQACPQHLPIVECLRSVAEKFEQGTGFPTRR